MKNKLFIFELDGGSWNIIKPLLSAGKLPNMARLMAEGTHGVLHSDVPIISPRIWTTIFTGKHSEKHGVEFFASTSSMVRQKRLWDILSERTVKVGVFGSLVTWPPQPVNGFMIPSIFSLGPETYPEEYQVLQEIALNERKKLQRDKKRSVTDRLQFFISRGLKLRDMGVSSTTFREALCYFVGEKLFRYAPKMRYWRKAALHLRMTTDVFIRLYHRFAPEFVTFHDHLCDAVSHRFWDCFEPGQFKNVPSADVKKYGQVIPRAYMLSDMMLGRMLSALDPSTTVLIVSDHGSKALPNTVRPYILNFDNLLGIFNIEKKVIPARFGLKGVLYFTDVREKESILEAIRSICLAETGEKVFDVESKDKYISLNPVPALWRRNIPEDAMVTIGGFGIHRFSTLFSRQRLKVTGIHDEEGIFIARGPGIKTGGKLADATVFDIAPTVLALMGYPVAEDMDGRVLTEVMSEEFLSEHPIQRIATYEEEKLSQAPSSQEEVDVEKIKERLGALGYL